MMHSIRFLILLCFLIQLPFCKMPALNQAGDPLSVSFFQTVLFRDLIKPGPEVYCDTSTKWRKTLGETGTNSVYVTTILPTLTHDIIIAGVTRKNLGTGKNFDFTGTEGTTFNWFIAKLSGGDGSIAWVDYFGETLNSIVASTDLNVLPKLNHYANGEFAITWSAKQGIPGALNAFGLNFSFGIARYDDNGSRKWHTYLNLSSNGDEKFTSAIDSQDNVHFFANVTSSGGFENFPTPTNSASGGIDIIYGLVSEAGTFKSQKYIGSNGSDKFTDAIRLGDSVYLGGETDNNITGTTDHPSIGFSKAYIAKLESNLTVSSILYRGSNANFNTKFRKFTTDKVNLYYIGTSEDSFGNPTSSFQGSSKNFFYESITKDLSPVWLTFLGSTGFSVVDGLRTSLLALESGKNLYSNLLGGSSFQRYSGIDSVSTGDGTGVFQKTLVKLNSKTGRYETVAYSSNFTSPKIGTITNTREICKGKIIRMELVLTNNTLDSNIFSELSVFPTRDLP